MNLINSHFVPFDRLINRVTGWLRHDPVLELFRYPRNIVFSEGHRLTIARKCRLLPGSELDASKFEEWQTSSTVQGETLAGECLLCLPDEQAFCVALDAPVGAARRVHDLITLELARLTPFDLSNAYWGWAVRDQLEGHSKLVVDTWIVLSSQIEEVADRIEALGSRLSGVVLRSRSGSVLPLVLAENGGPFDRQIWRKWQLISLAGGAACALALCFASWATITFQDRAEATLSSATAPVTVQAQKVKDEIKIVELNFAETEAFQKALNDSQNRIMLLEKLSKTLPESAYLTNLTVADDEVTLDGFSVSPEALVSILERSGFAKDISFLAPVVQNPGDSRSHFSLKFKWQGD